MKIFTADKIRELDAYTIQHEPIPSIDLMERASNAFVQWFVAHFPSFRKPIFIMCGIGNNGGDGLAISRLLLEKGYDVQPYVCRFSKKSSADFQVNEERLRKITSLGEIEKVGDIPKIPSHSLVIDAIFGSGLSRPVKGIAAKLIEQMNLSEASQIAVDISSGVYANQPNQSEDVHVQATHTVSFQLPKLAFMLPENAGSVGEWHVVDIGLSQKAIETFETPYHLVTRERAAAQLKPRRKFDHKGHFGHLLMIAGSKGKLGAAVLGVKASLRTGVGLVTAYVPTCGYDIMQTSAAEAMCLTDPSPNFLTEFPAFPKATAVALGPGIDVKSLTAQAMEDWLKQQEKPLVLDADGLNLLAQHPEWWQHIPPQSILTPHPKEFERLFGKMDNGYERLEKMQEIAKKYRIVVVLKGAHTAIATPDGQVHFNDSGNPGMATGGSGDVLTGILGALLAGPYPAESAAWLGVFLHGLAGDLAAAALGQEALSASDIITYLPEAFKALHREKGLAS